MIKQIFITLVLLLIGTHFIMAQPKEILNKDKIVIAHRGASGYLPEHTLASKAMAYAMQVDYIEQDVVLSQDGIPIVIHDIYLDDISNVHEIFPKKARSDGRFYVIDFTYQELKQLDVYERYDPKTKNLVYPKRFPYGLSTFKFHSLQDEIELIQGLNQSLGNQIGIYPEIKNPQFHLENGKDISKIVLKVLTEYGYRSKSDLCIVQCFDKKELKRIRTELGCNLFLVQLVATKLNKNILKEISIYANGIGPWYQQIDKIIVQQAHQLGLKVHAYTFRADDLGSFDSFEALLDHGFNELNLDGMFTDFPDKAVQFVKKL